MKCPFESCNKKINLISYKCNACHFEYCNIHRLPEVHKCPFYKELCIMEKEINLLNLQKSKL